MIAFVTVAALLVLLPGPDWALVLAAGLRLHAVKSAVAGLMIGYGLITAALVLGIAPLVAAAPAALLALTVLGAVYLIWVGTGILRDPSAAANVTESLKGDSLNVVAEEGVAPTASQRSHAGLALRQGVGVSMLNPKALLFFLAFLPQFARPSAPWPFGVQLAVLGGIWILFVAVFYLALGFTMQRALDRYPGIGRAITLVAGAAMVLAGVALLGERAMQLA